MNVVRTGAAPEREIAKEPSAGRRVLLRWLAACLGLAMALLTAEIALRLVGAGLATPRLPLVYKQFPIDQLPRGQGPLAFSQELGWITAPDASAAVFGVRYRHNKAGLRADREYTPAPASGVRRLAAYGESFTYCWSVDLDACWTDQLEHLLPNSEVLNFGVIAYGPDQAWLRYQREASRWHSCAVLIGYMVENVNRVVNRFRPFYGPTDGVALSKPRYLPRGDGLELLPNPARRVADLRDPLWVETNLGPHDAWYFPGMFVANPFDWLQVVSLGRTAAYHASRQARGDWTLESARQAYRPGTDGFETASRVLTGFADQVRADGASPVVVIFPTREEIMAQRDGLPKPHATLLESLHQRGVAALDMTDPLAEEARRTPPDALIDEHLRAKGNSIVARALADQLGPLTAPSCGG